MGQPPYTLPFHCVWVSHHMAVCLQCAKAEKKKLNGVEPKKNLLKQRFHQEQQPLLPGGKIIFK